MDAHFLPRALSLRRVVERRRSFPGAQRQVVAPGSVQQVTARRCGKTTYSTDERLLVLDTIQGTLCVTRTNMTDPVKVLGNSGVGVRGVEHL